MTIEHDGGVYSDEFVDPLTAGDRARQCGPVADRSDGGREIVGHAAVVEAALDNVGFSSQVSAHLQLPNGTDGEEHRRCRSLIDRYFTSERVAGLEPMMQDVAEQTVQELFAEGHNPTEYNPRPTQPAADLGSATLKPVKLDAVLDLGAPFAVRVQRRWLGWPESLEPELLQWVTDNQAASRSGDRSEKATVAERFDEIIQSVLRPRSTTSGTAARDVTTELMEDETLGRKLADEELVSILRNWTGGDLESIALCIGVILQFLTTHPTVLAQVRAGISREELATIIEEILRIDDPFVSNRRIIACPVDLGNVQLTAGDQVRLNWTSANRDPKIFGNPNNFDPHGNAEHNLVYGIGKHDCPGREMATTELCILIQELVTATSRIEAASEDYPTRAQTPAGGYQRVPVIAWPRVTTA